jgi:DNA-binding NarL/FixJ family response regulator
MTIRVLLVDDQATVREGLVLLLQQATDIDVVGAVADGQEAVRQAQLLKADVVVMDIAMRALNGIEAARLLRDRCPATRVVMLCKCASSEQLFRSFEAGAMGFVGKESGGREVVAAIRAAHAGRRYLSRALAALDLDARSRAGEASPLDRLSARERVVLQLVLAGRSSAEMATTARLSPKTVDSCRGRLMKKLGVNDLSDLARFAIDHGLSVPQCPRYPLSSIGQSVPTGCVLPAQ